MIRDLVRVGTKYGIEIPTEFTMVGKSLMTIEGIGKQIDPDFDLMAEAEPLFYDLLRNRYTPERIGNDLLRRLERLSGATYNVPQQLQEILADVRMGRLTLRTEDIRASRSADRVGRHIFSALVLSALLLAGAWLLASSRDYAGYALIATAVLWLGAHGAHELYHDFKNRL
jgi:ubiquinone biosynthesis protein